jgi:hypothetical protein
MIVNGSQIKTITDQGLTYTDENGEEKFINFFTCYENYLQRYLNQEAWEWFKQNNSKTDADWDDYVDHTKSWKEVARRNILTFPWGDGPFIEFHTEPLTRFKFANEDEFYRVRYEVEKTGWVTFDLS